MRRPHGGQCFSSEVAFAPRMLVLSRQDLEEILDMRVVIDAVERGVVEHARGTVYMPPRQIIQVGDEGTIYTMSAYLAGMGSAGVKIVSDFSSNVKGGPPSISGAVVLLDGQSGRPLCLLDGGYVTAMRTGAVSALAARSLSLVDSEILGIIGTGAQARTQVLGLWAVRDVQLVKAYSRRRENVRAFCRETANQLGVEALVADSPQEVVTGSDIVVTATSSKTPVLEGRWLEPGVHVNAIGGGRTKELDTEVYRRSRVTVDWREAVLEEALDLKEAMDAGAFSLDEIYAELGELVAGMKVGRTESDDITLFRSVGMALGDVVTAAAAYEKALSADVGQEVEI